MIVKNLKDCSYDKVLDGTLLCELLHPREGLKMNFSLAHAILQVGEASLPHRLKSVEVYYILEGEGLMQTRQK